MFHLPPLMNLVLMIAVMIMIVMIVPLLLFNHSKMIIQLPEIDQEDKLKDQLDMLMII